MAGIRPVTVGPTYLDIASYSIEAASEYRAVALEMFSDCQMSIGRHTRLAVAARTEDAG